MAKILVVDDETDLEVLIKQKFRQKIREHKYDFVFAINGKDALEKLQQHPDVDIMLCDINMPEMDGLTLLLKLKDVNPLIKSVIVTAYGDMDNIRTAMNRGAFDFVTKPVNFVDLELTVEKTIAYTNQVKETLQAIKENNILRMYVDETVLNFMNKKEYESVLTANETINATVAFIDICSFANIAETESPDTVVKLLNKYFDVMVKEVIDQNGYVDKFIGHTLMAVFRGDFHLDRAIDACLSLCTQIENFTTPLADISVSHQVAIGINCGELISGNIGSAQLRRLDYTVIGDVVNTAQRLQGVAKGGQILIGQAAYEIVKESFNCRPVGEVSFKNKTNPLMVYEVLA